MADVVCAYCGRRNTGDPRFCHGCGTAVPARHEHDQYQADPAMSPLFPERHQQEQTTGDAPGRQGDLEGLLPGCGLLVVTRGPNAGSRFLLHRDVVDAGRHPDSDVFLDDVTVSRRHAEFRRYGDAVIVRDLSSLNGTYLNRERVETATLSSGDTVHIGRFQLLYLSNTQVLSTELLCHPSRGLGACVSRR